MKRSSTAIALLMLCSLSLWGQGQMPMMGQQPQSTPPELSDVGAINVRGGSIQGVGSYERNTQATVVAQASEGYEFRHWKGEGIAEPTSPEQTISMDQNRSLTPIFERVWNVIVTAQPPEGGSVTGSGDYPLGSEVPITVTPNEGFTFQGWQGEGIDDPAATETFVRVNGNHDLIAIFEQENQNQNQQQNQDQQDQDQQSDEPQESDQEGEQDPQEPEEQDGEENEPEEQEGEQEPAEAPPLPEAMTREDAERLLDALQAEERKLPAGEVIEGRQQPTQGRDW